MLLFQCSACLAALCLFSNKICLFILTNYQIPRIKNTIPSIASCVSLYLLSVCVTSQQLLQRHYSGKNNYFHCKTELCSAVTKQVEQVPRSTHKWFNVNPSSSFKIPPFHSRQSRVLNIQEMATVCGRVYVCVGACVSKKMPGLTIK